MGKVAVHLLTNLLLPLLCLLLSYVNSGFRLEIDPCTGAGMVTGIHLMVRERKLTLSKEDQVVHQWYSGRLNESDQVVPRLHI